MQKKSFTPPFALHILSGYEPDPFSVGLLVIFVCLGVLCCFLGLFGFGFLLARLFSSGSYLLTPFTEFIPGDLCLSAHTALVPVQKKQLVALLLVAQLAQLLAARLVLEQRLGQLFTAGGS